MLYEDNLMFVFYNVHLYHGKRKSDQYIGQNSHIMCLFYSALSITLVILCLYYCACTIVPVLLCMYIPLALPYSCISEAATRREPNVKPKWLLSFCRFGC